MITFPLCGLYYLSLLFISASLAPCLSLLDDVVVLLLGQFLVLAVCGSDEKRGVASSSRWIAVEEAGGMQ